MMSKVYRLCSLLSFLAALAQAGDVSIIGSNNSNGHDNGVNVNVNVLGIQDKENVESTSGGNIHGDGNMNGHDNGVNVNVNVLGIQRSVNGNVTMGGNDKWAIREMGKILNATAALWNASSSFGMPVHFSAKDCGASSGHYQSSAVVPARPKTGEVFKVTNHFSFDEDITGGSFDVKVHALGGIQLKHATGPLCGSDTSYDVYLGLVKVASVTVYGSQCPIAKGPASIQYDIKLSPILPPALGDASFHLTAKDQKGTDIACVQALLAINLKNSHEAENADRTAQMVMV